ncbi:MAG: Sugar transferase [Candidatus Azambacteria bacterium GW2011_GWB1_42_17]|uniref:Sugar transferase n=2 Tax=Candidatus Azamiibacteriota TaxID=1752741 RepID=A0A0G0ZAU3_9BACT|nr:MAG: Sugar transferase [Candidatus Azambacteria bacterium GW2011_GWB1_42_17]KKS45769.1 MAG: Sugar transferase [Candidatus Azambacteria bacterium GW2011_GWA1_42_19]KKS88187.1 MAG: Sugar transferase [Parcubacteria group bacterium GW2011_GWC1_43_11]
MWRRRLKIFLLVISDVLILYAALGLTLFIRYAIIERDLPTLYSSAPLHLLPFTIIFFFWLIIFWAAGLYDIIKLRNEESFYKTLVVAFGINAAIAITFFYFIPIFIITPKINLFIHLALALALLLFSRQYFNRWARESLRIHLVFLGANSETMELKEFLSANPQLGYRVDDILAPDNFAELESLWQSKKFSLIVSAEKFDHSQKLAGLLFNYFKKGVTISDLDKFYENVTSRVPVSIIREIWFLENLAEIKKGFYETGKRIFDAALGIIFAIITVAIFPIAAIGIKIFDPGPIFYRQQRMGKNGRIFTLLKFRSLPVAKNTDNIMQKPPKELITSFGKFLRKSHWDELPQVWNILKNEMSFIGPRPEKPEFVARLSAEIPFYEMRHLVKPGIAGWAQLNNPNAGPTIKETLEKLQYDLYYVKNRSVFLDLSIILKTIKILLSGAGK